MKYKDTKLIVFLSAFSKEELSEFEKFLTNPYFKQSRDPLPLLKALKKYHPEYNAEKFSEESIFTELYPSSDFSNKKSLNNFRSLSSYMLKALEEFLFISDIRDKNVLKNSIVLEKLLDRNLLKYYDQYLQKAESDLAVHESDTGKDDIERIKLGSLNSRYYALKLDFKGYIENSINGVTLISTYFWINFLRTAKNLYLTELHSHIKTGNISMDKFLRAFEMEKILDLHKDTAGYTEMYFNYYTYMSLTNDCDNKHYNKAKEIFFVNKSAISRADKNYFYSDLINITTSSRNVSEAQHYRELFSLIDSCTKDSAYKVTNEDFMQPAFYRNAIIFANKLKEFEWAENFINEYTDELMPEYRDNMKYYSKAILYSGKGEFEKSLENISKVKYDLIDFKFDVKIVMLRLFYELEMNEQFYSLADSFRHFIRSSKNLSDFNKNAYLDYIKYFLRIMKLKESFDKNEAGILKDQISKEKNLYDKSSLLGRLDKFL